MFILDIISQSPGFATTLQRILTLVKHSINRKIIKPLYPCENARNNMAAILNSVFNLICFADCKNAPKIT